MRWKILATAGAVALAYAAAPASAATTLAWNPQSTDTGFAGDFDTATQTFAPVGASQISFAGNGYYHSHGSGTQAWEGFTVTALIDGISTTIYSSPITSFTSLSSLGTINFAGGNVSSITLASKSFVGNAFHSFDGESFTLSGDVNAAVPEPSTWALMLAGFAAIGFAMRRRPKQSVSVKFV